MKEGLEKEVKIFLRKRSLKEANKDFVEGRSLKEGFEKEIKIFLKRSLKEANKDFWKKEGN